MPTHALIATAYANDVVAGRVLACKWIKLACQRHLDHLAKSQSESYPYRFDESKAARACKFIEALPHVKGRWSAKNQLLKLEPWQVFAVACLFGWVERATGLRKYREAFWLIPRKNGKSPLAAAIGIYMTVADGEAGAETYCGATSEAQAWEVFQPAKFMVERTPALQEALGLVVNAKSLIVEADGSKFRPVIGKPGDGASVSCGICDEYHEADTAILYDTFRTGMVGREQPILLVISTSGFNVASPCHDLQVDAEKMLEGTLENERLFALIYTIDADTDWTTEEALWMANPNLGISVSLETLRYDQGQAVQNSSKQNTFKTKHLNVWCNADSAWMNMQAWKLCEDPTLDRDDFVNDPCHLGVDLASTTDLSNAVRVHTRMVNGKPHYYVFVRSYLPEDRIDQPECQHYQKWHHDGHLTATDGAAIDYEVIKRDLKADVEKYQVREACFDKTYAGQLMQQLAAETGVVTIEVPQRTMYLSPAMKALEAAVLDKRVHHTGCPVLTWAMSNVVAHPDPNDNVFPRKSKPELKIDPAVALITAFNRVSAASDPVKKTASQIYEERGVRFL